MRTVFTAILILGLGCGADWPQFRGPTQMGISTAKNLPLEWDTTKNVVWKIDVPGMGWSSPVIADGKVVITTAVEKDGKIELKVLAYDAKSGSRVWESTFDSLDQKGLPKNHPKNSYASPTCIIDGDAIYAHFGHMGTAKLKLADGSKVWQNRELAYKPMHGNGNSPVLHQGMLIFNIDGNDRQEVVALDASSGKVAWRTPRATKPGRPFSFCTCTVVDLFGKPQLITPGSDVVMSLDPKTGKEFWRFAYTGYSVVPRPVVADGVVYVCTSYDSSKLLAVKPTAEGGTLEESALLWKATKNAPHNPSLVYDKGLIYGVSDAGVASCWDAKTGEVFWAERVPDKYSSSILLAGDRLYLQAEDGTGTVLKTGKTYEVLATNKLEEKTLASYGVIDNALIIRTQSKLYRVEAK